jgi:hypothetical protein
METKTKQQDKKPTKKRHQRRPANLPARFAFRPQKNSKATQNGAGATQKTTTEIHGMASGHDRVKPTVSPKYAQTNSSLAQTMKRG